MDTEARKGIRPMTRAGELSGRRALVTGASQGIGHSVALALAAAGAKVYALGRNTDALEALVKESIAGEIVSLPADLCDSSTPARIVELLRQEDTQLGVLVHCAGVISHATSAEASLSDFDNQWLSNVRGPYALTQALIPMLGRGSDLVIVNSSVTRNPRPNSGQFAATQHAMLGIANSLREELNHHGVRVMSIFPGQTATPRQQELHRGKQLDYQPELMLQPEDVAAAVLQAVSMPRTAEITEVHIRPLQKS
jgi:NADP-dependent 3-hydroxy acid dehydrogenase YdfG